MTDVDREAFDLRDEDRLPWLEAVDDEDHDDGVSPFTLAMFVLAGLVGLGLVIGGIYWLQNRDQLPAGTGELIAAPAKDYKVKPKDAGGMKVDGKGDAAFATSEGKGPDGQIDLNAVTEDPLTGMKVVKTTKLATPPAAKVASADVPATAGALAAKAPPAPEVKPAAAAAGGGAVIQLGAFASEVIANKAWDGMSKRFNYLSGLGKVVANATVGGKTYYRLRANAGSAGQAKDICAKLKAAGENCLVVAN